MIHPRVSSARVTRSMARNADTVPVQTQQESIEEPTHPEPEPSYEYWVIKDDYSEPQHIVQNTKLTLKQLQSFVGGNIEIQSIQGMQRYFQSRIGLNVGPCEIPTQFNNMHWVVMNENPPYEKREFVNETAYINFTFEAVGTIVVAAKECFDM